MVKTGSKIQMPLAWAAGLCIVLCGRSEAVAAEKILALEQADHLCAANHAEPAKVLAAADTSGWVTAGADAPDILEMFSMVADPTIRVKTIGSDHLMLRVIDRSREMASGRLVSFECTISDEGPGSQDLRREVMRRFPVRRKLKAPHGMVWLYVDEGAQPRFMDESKSEMDKELRSGKTVMMTPVVIYQARKGVIYLETGFRRKP